MDEKKFGDKFYDLLIEEYKLYVETVDRVSNRRNQTNQFYISILTGLLTVIAFIFSSSFFEKNRGYLLLIASLMGLMFCFVWAVNIYSYRQLNKGKFKVIQDIEELLPFRPFQSEWNYLGKGLNPKKYLQATKIEQFVPIIISVLYVIMLLISFKFIN